MMKKLLIALLALITAFSCTFGFVACTQQVHTSDSISDSTNDGANDGANDGSTTPATTYITRAAELTRNIGKVPTATEVGSFASSASASTTSVSTSSVFKARTARAKGDSLIATTVRHSDDYVDLSDPDQNTGYQEYLDTGRLSADMYHTFISMGDNEIINLYALKETVLQSVVQLDTWVTLSGFEKYRLGYDALSDVATIESLSNTCSYYDDGTSTFYYTHVRSSYTADGKCVIEAYTVEVFNDTGIIRSQLSVFYTEDKAWIVSMKYYSDDMNMKVMNYVCACDLVSDSKEFFLLPYGNTILIKKSAPYFVDLRKEDYEAVHFDDGTPSINASSSYYYILKNSSEEIVGSWEYNISKFAFTLELDVYEIAGWDGFYYENGKYYLTVNGEIVAEDYPMFSPQGHVKNPTDCDGFSYDTHLVYDKDYIYCPKIRLTIDSLSDGISRYDTAVAVLEKLGLSIKDESVYNQLRYLDTCEQLLSEFNAFGLNGMDTANAALFEKILATHIVPTYTGAEILAMSAEPVIYDYQQEEDSSYYMIFSPAVNTQTVIDGEAASIDLSDVSMTMEGSALTTVGAEYTAAVVALSDFDVVLLDLVVDQYEGDSLTLSGLGSLALADLAQKLTEGEYRLAVCLLRSGNNGYARLSNFYYLTAEEGEYAVVSENLSLKLISDGSCITLTLSRSE